MSEPGNTSQEFLKATSTWPLALVIPVAVTLLLLAFFTTLELPFYVHGVNTPHATVAVVLGTYAITVVVWMMVEIKSQWYANYSVDKPRAWFAHHVERLPVFIVCFIVFGYGLRVVGFALIGFKIPFNVPTVLGLLLYESLKAVLLYCCWLGLTFGALSFARMRRQTEHLLATQKALADARLAQLQGQLRPHFLFNALNTISALMQVDVPRADRLLSQLGDLLRANLSASERSTVPLGEELKLLRQYAAIMQERFAGRVTVEWEVDAAAVNAWVPTMLLQPLLENAFKHGVERNAGHDTIVVAAERSADTLCVSIHNQNSNLAADYRQGLGLRNCRERLNVLYGAGAGLALTHGQGVTATVTLPWMESA